MLRVFTIVTSTYFSFLLKQTKKRTDSERHSSYLFLVVQRRSRSVYLPGFLNPRYFPLLIKKKKIDDCIRKALLRATGSPTRGRSQKSLHQMFRTCFSRAKMRKKTQDLLRDRPYQLLRFGVFVQAAPVSCVFLKRKRVGSVRYPMWVPY